MAARDNKFMNIEEAKELLSFHSTRNSDIDNPKWENGFLGSLRPFSGELHNENFFEVMECWKAMICCPRNKSSICWHRLI